MMDEAERKRLTAEILKSSLSSEIIELVIRQLGVNGLSDEALRRAAELARALEHEIEGPALELE